MTGSHAHPNALRRTQLVLVLICAFSLVLPSLALGQLTDDDIEALRQRGIAEGWTFTVGKNAATEYSLEQLCGLRVPDNWESLAKFDACTPTRTLPDSFDWREEVGGLPPVRNQGGCGSCWAFATVGPLECNIKIQDGIVQDLSEQYLVSCNSSGWGCDGGWWAHDYHISWPDECDSSGAVMEADFPYLAYDAPCGCPYPHPYKLTDWVYIGSSGGVPDVDAMKQAIMDHGPISVGIYASNAMKAYTGGIFNSCETGTINHGVTVVGWQDMFGSGVWIVRNSWGANWGEGGYMRIPYYCNDVGYGAAYVVYDGGLGITADTTYGDAPLEVAFEASSGLEVDTWSWEFGDGGSDDQQSCVHTYTAPGMYTVTAEISAGGDIRSRVFENFVIVLADTLCSFGDSGRAGDQVVIPLYVRNHAPLSGITIPLQMTGDFVPRFDSISTETGREASLDTISFVNWDSNHGRYTFTLSPADPTQPGLAPGSGPVAYLYLTLPLTAQAGQTVNLSTSGYSIYVPEFSWPRFAYTPKDGGNATITVSSCCIGMTGNIDGSPDDLATISDLTKLVNHMFVTFEPLPCPAEGNVSGDLEGAVDVSDLSALVDHLFITFGDLPECR